MKPAPPLLPLRAGLLVSLFALAGLMVVHGCSIAVAWLAEQGRIWATSKESSGKTKCCSASSSQSSFKTSAADSCAPTEDKAKLRPGCTVQRVGASSGAAAGIPVLRPGGSGALSMDVSQSAAAPVQVAPKERLDSGRRLQDSSGVSKRIAQLHAARPRLVSVGALAAITCANSGAFICQMVAPGFVDPSLGEEYAYFQGVLEGGQHAEHAVVQPHAPPALHFGCLPGSLPNAPPHCRHIPAVQLVNLFGVLGVALVQRFLLGHRLPLLIWPCRWAPPAHCMAAGRCQRCRSLRLPFCRLASLGGRLIAQPPPNACAAW